MPKRPGWTVDGQLVRTAAGELLPGALAPARRVVETTVTTNSQDGAPVEANKDALISEFLRTSREMVAAQRDVLLTYFGATQATVPQGTWIPAPAPAVVEALPQLPALPAAVETPAAQQPAAQPESAPEAVTEDDVLRVVLEIISERTGYPVDMIEPDLDLEADLSIDSIKRAEIAGELAQRLGIGGGADIASLDDAELEDLAKARTAASVTGWLSARLTEPAPVAQTPPSDNTPQDEVTGTAPKRLQLRPVLLAHQDGDSPADPASVLGGRRFVLYGDGEGAEAVVARLSSYGAEALIVGPEHQLTEADGQVDGVLYLAPLTASAPVLPEAFPVFQAALARNPRQLIAVQGAENGSAGLHGLFRTVAREYPDTVARVVEVTDTAPAAVADALLAELLAPGSEPVVLRTAAGRHGLELVETPLGALATNGAGPAGDGVAEAAAIGLDRDAVVLLVGGARGITAKFAVALAAASRCRIELL
ncbi:acyl carrier protein, partial [Streptomyces sp. W16]|uniref:acyl carrier protein n=1 Tax=Streptomyces sp. W16 TaxID=3076631 RepID=UPI00295AC9CF